MSDKENPITWSDYYEKTREERLGALARIDQTSNWSITITAIVCGTSLLPDGPPLFPLAGIALLCLPLYLEADRYRYFIATDRILRKMHDRFLLQDAHVKEDDLKELVSKYDRLELGISFWSGFARRMKRVYAIQFLVLTLVGWSLAMTRLPASATVVLDTVYGGIGLITIILVATGWKPPRRD